MKLDDLKGLRAQWVKARDGAKPKVEKGAVKGVSLGDAIDEVYKGSRKGHLQFSRAIEALLKASNKYKAAIKVKNKDLAAWIEKNIDKPLAELLDQAGDDVGRLEGVRMEMQNLHVRTDLYFPDGEEFHKVGRAAEKQGIDWQVAAKPLMSQLEKSLAGWKAMSRSVSDSAGSLVLSMPVKPSKNELNELAKQFEHEITLVSGLVKTKSLDEFAYKAKGCRDSWHMLHISAESTRKAIVKLLA